MPACFVAFSAAVVVLTGVVLLLAWRVRANPAIKWIDVDRYRK